jgi:KDO2-lipid IV(A) lauroyltransferase
VARFVGGLLFRLLNILAIFAYFTPFGLRKAVAHFCAWFLFSILRLKRRVALINLSLVFKRNHQESMDDYRERLETIAFRNYVHYFLCVFEILERTQWDEKDLGTRVRVSGDEHVWNALDKKRGFFFLTAHLGNWELISKVGVLLRYPLAIVTKSFRNAVFDEVWRRSRIQYGLTLLNETGSGLALAKGIQKSKAIGFIFDQYTGEPHGLKARFLGIQTGCPKGLAILAPRLHAPVLPAYLVRMPDGVLELTIEKELDFSPAKEDGPDKLKSHIEICNQNLEKWIRKYPEQYLWIHKRFKDSVDYQGRLSWEV